MSEAIEVVAAIIRFEARYLCVQRGSHKYDYLAGKFEFPGGKIEDGESQELALRREIREELGMDILPVRHLMSVRHQYPDFNLVLHAWICETESPELELREHQSACWLMPSGMSELDWAAADLPLLGLL
jgi:8-oxo-dGTP diphosphatase